jgi:hypothetical protein
VITVALNNTDTVLLVSAYQVIFGPYASEMRLRYEHPRQDPYHRSGKRGERQPSGW